MTHELIDARYIAFTSFRGDGSPVKTPVWVVPFDDGYAFTTEAGAHKVRRIRNNNKVTVAVCDYRGNIAADATVYSGTAFELDTPDIRRVEKLVARKYRIGRVLLAISEVVSKVLHPRRTSSDGAIKFVLD